MERLKKKSIKPKNKPKKKILRKAILLLVGLDKRIKKENKKKIGNPIIFYLYHL